MGVDVVPKRVNESSAASGLALYHRILFAICVTIVTASHEIQSEAYTAKIELTWFCCCVVFRYISK